MHVKNKPDKSLYIQKDTNVKKINFKKLIRIRKQQKCISEIYAIKYSSHISFSRDINQALKGGPDCLVKVHGRLVINLENMSNKKEKKDNFTHS